MTSSGEVTNIVSFLGIFVMLPMTLGEIAYRVTRRADAKEKRV